MGIACLLTWGNNEKNSTTSGCSGTCSVKTIHLRASEAYYDRTVSINIDHADNTTPFTINLSNTVLAPTAEIYLNDDKTSSHSASGSVTVTKLTLSEIEGSFSTVQQKISDLSKYTISDGKFAGKLP